MIDSIYIITKGGRRRWSYASDIIDYDTTILAIIDYDTTILAYDNEDNTILTYDARILRKFRGHENIIGLVNDELGHEIFENLR